MGQVTFPCKLFDIVGVSNLSIMPDWMHDKPLGTDKVHPPMLTCGLNSCLRCI
jgi:hypothetical protein